MSGDGRPLTGRQRLGVRVAIACGLVVACTAVVGMVLLGDDATAVDYGLRVLQVVCGAGITVTGLRRLRRNRRS